MFVPLLEGCQATGQARAMKPFVGCFVVVEVLIILIAFVAVGGFFGMILGLLVVIGTLILWSVSGRGGRPPSPGGPPGGQVIRSWQRPPSCGDPPRSPSERRHPRNPQFIADLGQLYALAAYSVAVSVKSVAVGRKDPKPAIRDFTAVQVWRIGTDADRWIGSIALGAQGWQTLGMKVSGCGRVLTTHKAETNHHRE